mmetsp:Transcript_1767/g.2390  ORF Transcript_1767/g.2390 Transcript_1767/m.2390 type:complete len:584 (+) Transcript_1767:82-1833(+)
MKILGKLDPRSATALVLFAGWSASNMAFSPTHLKAGNTESYPHFYHEIQMNPKPPRLYTVNKASGDSQKYLGEEGKNNAAYPKATKNGPSLLRNDQACRLWHKFLADRSFRTFGAQICVGLELSTPLAYASPEHAALTRLLAAYLTAAPLPFGDQSKSEEADYKMVLDLRPSVQGLKITLECSTKKSLEILTVFGHQLAVLPEMISKPTFEAVRQEVLESLCQSNSLRANLDRVTEQTLTHPCHFIQELRAFLLSERCEPGRLVAFTRSFTHNVFLEALVVGGLSEVRASKLVQAFWAALRARPLSDVARHSIFRQQVLDLPVGCTQTRQISSVPVGSKPRSSGNAVEIYLQVGPQEGTPLQDALLDLLAEVLKDQPPPSKGKKFIAFTRRLHGVQGFSFCLEDHNLSCNELEDILEKWSLDFRQSGLQALQNDDFLRYKQSILSSKYSARSFQSKFKRYWKEICMKTYHFERPNKEVIGLKLVEKNVLMRFWDEYICLNAQSRRKLLATVEKDTVKQELEGTVSNPYGLVILESSGQILSTKEDLKEFWSRIRKITPPSPQNELADELIFADPLDFRIDELV